MKTNTKAVHEAFLDQIKQDFAARGIAPVVNRYDEEEYTVQTIVGPYTCHAPYYEDAMNVDGIVRHPSCPNKIMIVPEDRLVQSATID